MVINMKENKRKNMKKTIIKRWVWILIAIMLCIVFAILLNKLQPFGTFLPALEECDVLAIQVTESTDVDGSFVYYYSEDSSEIKSFCDAVSTAKVSISGLHHGHKLIEYEEKMCETKTVSGMFLSLKMPTNILTVSDFMLMEKRLTLKKMKKQ